LQANPDKTAKDVTIACYGLAFKADIDDLRESPALNITKLIAKEHAGVTIAVEPNLKDVKDYFDGFELVNFNLALKSANIHLMLVGHKEFKFHKNKAINIIDTTGIWS